MSPLNNIETHLARCLLSEKGWTQYQQGDVSKAELQPYVGAIHQLSALYTGHSVGQRLRSVASSELSAAAYALYYLPINAAKLLHLAPLLDVRRPLVRVLDFGSGPGTAALSLLAASDASFEFTCVDHSAGMRAVAQKLISAWPANDRTVTVSCQPKLPTGEGAQYDVVCAVNSIAELNEEESADVIGRLLDLLAPDGTLLLMEPGQQLHTRRLMEIRNKVLQSRNDLVPLFPCTRRDDCPMLRTSAHDWCHGTLEWRQPPLNMQLDAALSFNKHRIKYSAFVFKRKAELLPGYRVIIPAEKSPKGIEATVCGADFYGPVHIRKGERTAENRPLEKADSFERLVVEAGIIQTPSSSHLSNAGPL